MLSLTTLMQLCLLNVIVDVCKSNGVFADKEPTVPEIIVGPVNATVFVDRNHTFYCKTAGYPRPVILWQKKNQTTSQWSEVDRSNGRIRLSAGRFVINRLLAMDSGFYRCIAENSVKNTSSGVAFLTVQAKAAIVKGPKNHIVTFGSEVSLFCEAVGMPLPVRIWFRNGVVIKNQTTRIPISGPRISFNATMTSTFECKVQNIHMEGMSNVSSMAIVRVVDGKCEPYVGKVCKESLNGSFEIFSILSEPDYQWNMEKVISGKLEEMKENNVLESCTSRVLPVLCRMAFPPCRVNGRVSVKQMLCKESCMAVKNLYCNDWWGNLELGEHFDCHALPFNFKATEKCDFMDFFQSDATETTNCYTGSGESYIGKADTSISGHTCQAWNSDDPHRHRLSHVIIPSLTLNHCRNPGGLRDKPWCYTTNVSVEWEYCDVPVCENSTMQGHNQTISEDPTHVYAIVIAFGAVLIMISAASCYLVWRHRRKRRSHNISMLHRHDDENLMAELQMLPSVEVVAQSAAQSSRFSRYEFDRNHVIHVEDIAVGAFGPVFKARLNARADQNGLLENNSSSDPGKQFIAVKMLESNSHESVQHEFVRQASLVASFNHPNIVRLVGVCFIGSPLCIALEFMGRGDLHSFLPTLKPSHFIYSAKYYVRQLLISQQLVSILVHLERLRFLHRDLAARNFLVSSENLADDIPLVKLADFGLAVKLELGENVHTGIESEAIAVRWTAPESIAQGHFSFASDIWSFGVLLWEVFSYGEKPYKHIQSLEDVSRFILNGGQLESPCPDHPEMFDLMKRCWHVQPKLRCCAGFLSSSIGEIIKNL